MRTPKPEVIVTIKDTNDVRNYFYAYSMAVKSGLLKIEKKIRRNQKSDNSDIIPILFLMRHSIELGLKLILKELAPQHTFKGAFDGHNLLNIIGTIGSYGFSIESNCPQLWNLANEISNVDIDGTYFKYATNKKNQKTFKPTEIKLTLLRKSYSAFLKEYSVTIKKFWPKLFM